ncbi:8310_t:CDS:1 [Cetraspora pellucida]|uniref:8310_t:CDS:1 n=1 Tax=Cetraspora pellucida TaxID=1433469 RepID=A0ACA9LNT0_9GLOM|nr:8310_t:CDS:1 [Cetraspora pellucida]
MSDERLSSTDIALKSNKDISLKSNKVIALKLNSPSCGPSVGAATNVLNVADEILINFFKFITSPKNFASSCKRFSIIARDEHARAEWIICQYGKAHALFHAIRLGPSFINLPVAKAIVAKKAILSRYFVQKLLINFGKHDQQLLELKIAHNIMGHVDINRINHKVPWSSNLQIPVFTYLMT